MKQALKITLNLFFLFLLISPSYSEEKKENINEHSLNFYTGMFDYSDEYITNFKVANKKDITYTKNTGIQFIICILSIMILLALMKIMNK